jgi:hypothetical protein
MLLEIRRGHTFRWVFPMLRPVLSVSVFLWLAVSCAAPLCAQTRTGSRPEPPALEAVKLMVKNEITDYRDHHDGRSFRFLSIERSARTGGQLWTEEVVEVDGGLLRRLVAVNGKPLTPGQQASQQRRLEQLVRHPEEFSQLNEKRQKDEARVREVLERMPREFLFHYDGQENGCRRIDFRPNPAYRSVSFEDRVVHNMAGVVEIKEPSMRLCAVRGHLVKTVDFGFGLLGHIAQGSGFTLDRTRIEPSVWRSTLLKMHFDGTLFFFKSISRRQHTVRRDFQPIPANLNLEQAVALSLPSAAP